VSLRGLSRALLRLAPLYAAVGAAFLGLALTVCIHKGLFGYDFRGTTWGAGKQILHGHSPYPPADADVLLRQGNPVVYPAPTLVVTTPLALLPANAAAAVWDVLSLIALLAALRIVGVRDWRVFAIVLLSCPAYLSFKLAQLDSFLALGCALAWRWRHSRGLRLALCVGAAVAAKVLLWPLVVWLFAIGRRRQAVGAVAVAAAAAAAGWAVVGFSTLRAYPHLMSAATDAFGDKGYSLMALGTRLGLGSSSARLLPFAAAFALCAAIVVLARRRRHEEALMAAVAAGILGSPILWLQYVLILMVVMAVKRPALSAWWALALVFWLGPDPHPTSGRAYVVGFTSLLLLVGAGLWPDREARTTSAQRVEALAA
jgi:hypothetical protein